MQYFPQLATGSVGQFPIKKRRILRTVVSASPSGAEVKWRDAQAARVEWEFTFKGMSDTERQTLEDFFEQMQGRLGSFVFLDPTSNLLKWSEALDAAAWQRDSFVSVTAGLGDPSGTTRASQLSNGGQAPARIQQTIEAPGKYQYAFSAYLRNAGASTITLFASAGAAESSACCEAGPDWRRFCLKAEPGGAEETVRFGLEVPVGGAVEVFGLQVEAQPSASVYQRSTSRGGVYANSRFAEDVLEISATGPGEHSGTVRIFSMAA